MCGRYTLSRACPRLLKNARKSFRSGRILYRFTFTGRETEKLGNRGKSSQFDDEEDAEEEGYRSYHFSDLSSRREPH